MFNGAKERNRAVVFNFISTKFLVNRVINIFHSLGSRSICRGLLKRLHNDGDTVLEHNYRDVIRATSFMTIKVRNSFSHLFSS